MTSRPKPKRATGGTPSDNGSRATSPRVIRKYPNRRLYDTVESRYVTLADVRRLVIERVDFVVLDRKTQQDITRSILLQVIAEQEGGGESLMSRDFLDSGSHPEMTFVAASAQRTGESTFVVAGELTLLGKRRPLTLEATLNKSAPYPFGDRAEVMGVSARAKLKRSEFGMTYGVADDLVGDDVEIVIEFEARKAP